MFIKGLRFFSIVIMITSGIALLTSKLVHSQSQCSVRLLSISLQSFSSSDSCNLIVKDAGSRVVNGNYIAKDPKVLPKGFIKYEPFISIICDHLIWIFLFNLEYFTNHSLYVFRDNCIYRTCDDMGWNSESMWLQLSNQVSPWWKHTDNESYIYYNKGDGQVDLNLNIIIFVM
jgi:hypothetical protein